MGKLIAVVGNSGVGKTTLVRALAQSGEYFSGLESHIERPYQALFARDLRAYALPNQIDYLLYRAEQEQEIRRQPLPGLMDGGLDFDYQVFTRYFNQRGYLDATGFSLCTRLYVLLRSLLPPPDLLIYLQAPAEVAAERMRKRSRGLEIARTDDLQALQALLESWLAETSLPVVRLDASIDDPGYAAILPELWRAIAAR
jgi:hypothetical protein